MEVFRRHKPQVTSLKIDVKWPTVSDFLRQSWISGLCCSISDSSLKWEFHPKWKTGPRRQYLSEAGVHSLRFQASQND